MKNEDLDIVNVYRTFEIKFISSESITQLRGFFFENVLLIVNHVIMKFT